MSTVLSEEKIGNIFIKNFIEKDDYEKFLEKGKMRRYDINGNDISDDITKCEYCGNEVNLKDQEQILRQSSEGIDIVNKLYEDIDSSEEEGCAYDIPYLKTGRFVTPFVECCKYPYYSPYAARMDGKRFSKDVEWMKENAIKRHKIKLVSKEDTREDVCKSCEHHENCDESTYRENTFWDIPDILNGCQESDCNKEENKENWKRKRVW